MPVGLTRRGGYAGEVTLTLDALPAGVTGAFAPATLPSGTTSSLLTLTVVATAAASTTPITIRATGSGVADKTATVQLTITRPPPSTLPNGATNHGIVISASRTSLPAGFGDVAGRGVRTP